MKLRDEIVSFIIYWHERSGRALCYLIAWAGISHNRFYHWKQRKGQPNKPNLSIPKKHWILDWEREAITRFATEHSEAGYRRITYLMLDQNVVAVSPSTTYRMQFGVSQKLLRFCKLKSICIYFYT